MISSTMRRALAAALIGLMLLCLPLFSAQLAARPAPAKALPTSLSPAGGHVLGNPQARIVVVEYMSYTCPHCAAFEAESAAPLRAGFIAKGAVSFEVRHFLRDPVDLAAALIANCAPPERFFALHQALLHAQPGWFPIMSNASAEQHKRWEEGDTGARMRAIASDMHLYELAARAGVSHESADRCLADEALMHRITAQTIEADKIGVTGTPSFTVNGLLLAGTHSWDLLAPQLQARM